MNPKLLTIIALTAVCLHARAQQTDTLKTDTTKTVKASGGTNPIIFANLNSGFSVAGLKGFTGGFQLTGGFSKNLFSYRYSAVTDGNAIGFIILLPLSLFKEVKTEDLIEHSLMYGRQFVKGGRAFNLMAGVSYNHLRTSYINSDKPDINRYFAGVPFEASVMWFKADRRRFKILGLIPVGGPTGFGHSFCFKFYGNISQRGYAALGIVAGLGYHKQYTE